VEYLDWRRFILLGGTTVSRSTLLVVSACLLLAATPALAREDIGTFSVELATKNVDQSKVLEGISWHMAGAKHGRVAKRFEPATTTKSTNAFMKSDEAACSRAFMSAIIQLQTRARTLGANAVIDIKSHASGKSFEEATIFGCVAGNVVARVSLTGTPANLK
jgi:uncharacterized protein YbjQ (UPF0145 family)